MKQRYPELNAENRADFQQGDDGLCALLQSVMAKTLVEYADEFVQDLSHISTAANYSGELAIEKIEYLKDNLYRCHYGYNWAIDWTCSGTQEAGRVIEKVRFTLADDGEIDFKFLKFD